MNRQDSKSSSFYDTFDSPIGSIYVIFSGKYLLGIEFTKPLHLPRKNNAAPKRFMRELSSYFQGRKRSFNQDMKFLSGTDFEKKVWLSLNKIPFGETRTYKWVAGEIGNTAAVRAVGRALSKNPLPIVIPCHRVIESDGSIGGYSSGIEIKRRLLDLEYYAKMNKKS